MSQSADKASAQAESNPLSLDGLEMTPDWVKGPAKKFSEPKDKPARHHQHPRKSMRGRGQENGAPRDGKRSGGRFSSAPPGKSGSPRKKTVARAPHRHKGSPPATLPLDVAFIPEEQGFAAMIEKMKSTMVAYALFDLAKLVLAKPQRYQVRITRQVDADGSRPPLYRLIKGPQIFLDHESALSALMRRHRDLVAREVRTAVEPPKGNFTFVNRCGITGICLGPPNYHEYQTTLVHHHRAHVSHLPFEKFKARIQTVHDEEAVKQWLDSVSLKTQYACVLETPGQDTTSEHQPPPDPPEPATELSPEQLSPALESPADAMLFNSLAELEDHLVEHHRDTLILAVPEIVIDGSQIGQLDHRGIVQTLRQAWERERRFPIKTVNELRPRLRQAGFHFFKHPDGVVYLTQARLKRFDAGALLSDEVKKILQILRQDGGVTSTKLMAAILSPSQETADASSATKTLVSDSHPPAVADDAPKDTRVLAEEEPLLAELRWLITEGYVVELSDGRLWAAPEKAVTPTPPPVAESPADPAESAPAKDHQSPSSPADDADSQSAVAPPSAAT